MLTKDEITEKLFAIIDSVAITGFFSAEEIDYIDELERQYYIQT